MSRSCMRGCNSEGYDVLSFWYNSYGLIAVFSSCWSGNNQTRTSTHNDSISWFLNIWFTGTWDFHQGILTSSCTNKTEKNHCFRQYVWLKVWMLVLTGVSVVEVIPRNNEITSFVFWSQVRDFHARSSCRNNLTWASETVATKILQSSQSNIILQKLLEG